MFKTRRQRSDTPIRQGRHDLEETSSLFRRSRTLTGSISSQVSAATEPRSQLRSPRLKEHDLRHHRRRLFWLLCLFVVSSASLAWLIRQYTTRLTIDQSVATSTEYVASAEQYLTDRPIERIYVLFNQTNFSRAMTAQHPELESALIEDTGFFEDTLTIRYRTAVARWQLGDVQYFVDANGIAFQRNMGVQPSLTVKDESGLPPASQQIIASTKMMKFIGIVVGTLGTQIGTIKEITIPPATLKEVDITFDNRPYKVRLNIDRDPAGQATDVIAAVKHLDKLGVTPEYVDARVEGKAFYKAP